MANVKIEVIQNFPLASSSVSDLDDYDVFTSAHFLLGRPIAITQEPYLLTETDYRLYIWQKLTINNIKHLEKIV